MYQVRLDAFEGPLDLLLFFIQRDELDVLDIPIARITDEFLGYVRALQRVDLDGAADFVYMAAVLIAIKARMLLPRQDAEGDDEEDMDPRRELVQRLLDYVRFKEVAEDLDERQAERARRFVRGAASAFQDDAERDEPPELHLDGSVLDLVRALGPLLREQPDTTSDHAVVRETYVVEDQQEHVLRLLTSRPVLAFGRLVTRRSKAFAIATFLAVLELARQGHVRLALDEAATGFYVLAPEAEQPSGDGAPT